MVIIQLSQVMRKAGEKAPFCVCLCQVSKAIWVDGYFDLDRGASASVLSSVCGEGGRKVKFSVYLHVVWTGSHIC